jgi:hypothetical protein
MPAMNLPMIISHWSDIASLFESIPGKIEGFFSAAGTWLEKAGIDILHGLITGLEYVSPLYWVVHYKSQILDALKDAGKWLEDVGKAIIDGLVNGIKSGFHLVTDALHGLVGLVKHIPIIGGLIGSPSPYFTEVGHAIGSGLTNGVTSSTGSAVAAVQRAAASLRSVPFHLGPTGSVAASLAGGTSNPSALAGAGSSSASGALSLPPMPLTVEFHLDGTKLATVLLPDIRAGFLRQKRATVNLGLG